MTIKRQYRKWFFYVLLHKTKHWNRESEKLLKRAQKVEYPYYWYGIGVINERDFQEARGFVKDVLTTLIETRQTGNAYKLYSTVIIPINKLTRDLPCSTLGIEIEDYGLMENPLEYKGEIHIVEEMLFEIHTVEIKKIAALSLKRYLLTGDWKFLKLCKQCSIPYLPYNRRNVFCSEKCRNNFFNPLRKLNKQKQIVKI